MSKQIDNTAVPNLSKLPPPPLIPPNLPLMNFFIPPPNLPPFTRPLMQQNFHSSSNQRGNYKPYFNFNEFNTKRNCLIEKFLILQSCNVVDTETDKQKQKIKSDKQKINV